MKDILFIATEAGFRDGLNPCIFLACTAFFAYTHWLKKGPLRTILMRFVFGLLYVVCFIIFSFGPGIVLVSYRNFTLISKVFYLVLSAGAFVLGCLFVKDWFILRFGGPSSQLTDEKIKPFTASAWVVYPTTILMALDLSALTTHWPINNYILLLANESLLRNQLQVLFPLVICYAVVCMWPLWFLWVFISIKNLRPAWLKIVSASFFFTASTCIMFVFK